MPDIHESYEALYEAPGRKATRAKRGATAEVRKLLAETAEDTKRLPEEALAKLRPVFSRAQRELEQELSEWLSERPHAGDRFTAHKLRQMLAQVRAAKESIEGDVQPELLERLQTGYVNAAEVAQQKLIREISRLSQIFSDGPTGLMRLDVPTVARLVDANSWKLAQYPKLVERYGVRSLSRIRNTLAVGVAKNESYGEMTRRIVGYMPRGSSKQKAIDDVNRWVRSKPGTPPPNELAAAMAGGLLRGPYADAERLVRTEMASALGAHQMQSYRELAAEMDPDEGPLMKRWDASSDRRCVICHALDGETVRWDQPFSSGDMHEPRHPNCRCTTTPWMSDFPKVAPLPPLDDGVALRRGPTKPVVTRGGTAIESRRKLERKTRDAVKKQPRTSAKRHGKPVVAQESVQARQEALPKPPPASPLSTENPEWNKGHRSDFEWEGIPEIDGLVDDGDFDNEYDAADFVLARDFGISTTDLNKMYEPPPGYQAKYGLLGYHTGPHGAWMEIEGEVYEKNPDGSRGRFVAEVNRTLSGSKGKLNHVSHDSFFVEESFQGKGVGSAMIRTQFRNYERVGVEKVELGAAQVGKYYWAKLGFEMSEHSQRTLGESIRKLAQGKRKPREALGGRRTEPDLSTVPKAEREAMLKLFEKDPTLFARARGAKVKFNFQGQEREEPWNKAMLLSGDGWDGSIKVGSERWNEARSLQEREGKK